MVHRIEHRICIVHVLKIGLETKCIECVCVHRMTHRIGHLVRPIARTWASTAHQTYPMMHQITYKIRHSIKVANATGAEYNSPNMFGVTLVAHQIPIGSSFNDDYLAMATRLPDVEG